MNDKELADAVVALGVIVFTEESGYRLAEYELYFGWSPPICDWRVAGALLEKVDWIGINDATVGATVEHKDVSIRVDTSKPRAIIEACVKALVD